jgi:outer membrane protein OmpA-like peptidoglycan-associated protein
VLLLLVNYSFSQTKPKNLVPNPSFEIRKSQGGNITGATPWKGVGTVDYYTKVYKKDTSKYKGARTGKCYAGLRFQPDYKEYMYVKLTEKLKKNKTYYFEMHARLLTSSTVAIKQLGVYFSEAEFKVGMVFKEEGLVDTIYKKGLSGLDWITISGTYQSQGTETYIIVGNFRTKMKDDMVKKNKWDIFEASEAYYFIDDISVVETNNPNELPENTDEAVDRPDWMPASFRTGKPFEIKNLQFEPDKAIIMESSYPILEELATVLSDSTIAEIQIIGHVDDFGDDAQEKQLSKERAKAVYDFLKTKNIRARLIYKGLGASQPVAPNSSAAYKAQNRRVEIVIIPK